MNSKGLKSYKVSSMTTKGLSLKKIKNYLEKPPNAWKLSNSLLNKLQGKEEITR